MKSKFGKVVEVIGFQDLTIDPMYLIPRIDKDPNYEYAIQKCVQSVNKDNIDSFSLALNEIRKVRLAYYENDISIVEVVSVYNKDTLCDVFALSNDINDIVLSIVHADGSPFNDENQIK